MILITGGCGFLGRRLAMIRAQQGERVLILDDKSTPGSACPDHPNIRWTPLDLSHPNLDQFGLARTLRSLMGPWGELQTAPAGGGARLREIWHFASPASPPLYKARQLDTLRLGGNALDALLSLACSWGATLIYASSSEVYGDPLVLPTPETEPSRIHPTGPRSCYDAAKVYGEALCTAWAREHHVDARIVRIFNTYGPGMSRADGRLVPALIGAALDGTPFQVHGDGLQRRTLSYLDDTVAGLLAVAACCPDPTPVNVGGTDNVSVGLLVALVEETLGVKVDKVSAPAQDEHDPRARTPDLTRLRSFGWFPRTSLREGIRLTAQWLKENR